MNNDQASVVLLPVRNLPSHTERIFATSHDGKAIRAYKYTSTIKPADVDALYSVYVQLADGNTTITGQYIFKSPTGEKTGLIKDEAVTAVREFLMKLSDQEAFQLVVEQFGNNDNAIETTLLERVYPLFLQFWRS